MEITEQPADASAGAGEAITFHVAANKADARYQWQWKSRIGKTWTDCTYTGANTDTFSFTMKSTLDGRLYRCVVSSGSQQVISEAATVTFQAEPLEITEQPADASAPAGGTITFHVQRTRQMPDISGSGRAGPVRHGPTVPIQEPIQTPSALR